MGSLKDIHLISREDLFLDNNPFVKKISKKLDAALKAPKVKLPLSSSEKQCGSIPIEISKVEWDKITNDLTLSEWMQQQRELTAKELLRMINEYLEKKCEDYCKHNRIPVEVWKSFATSEYFPDNRWEVRYQGELVCGVKVFYELKQKDFSEKTSISLEMY